MLIPFASTTKMSPLPVPPFHLRPTCHLEKEAKQQSSTHQAVFHLPALHKAPTKRYYHLWLFGVTSLSREKILTSARSDSHSHRIQLWNTYQHPSLFTGIFWQALFIKKRRAISDTNNAFHLCLTVFRCPKSTRASIDLNIAEQVFACCSPLTTFSWELYLEFERASYGKHLKGSHKPAVADSLTLEWIGIQQNRFERLLFQLSAITRVVGEAPGSRVHLLTQPSWKLLNLMDWGSWILSEGLASCIVKLKLHFSFPYY